MKRLLFTTLIITSSFLSANIAAYSTPLLTAPKLAQKDGDENLLTPQQVQQTAKNITVRITSENNGGSGVIIAKKGDSYLILTNAHVVNRSNSIAIQAPDGQKYQAKSIDGGFNTKYDLALLQFTSKTKYTLAKLEDRTRSTIEPTRKIYSSGFPFDSRDLRITSGEVSQLTDIPFDDGTQLGYVTSKGEKGIRQGMSGGAIFDAQGNFLGINTLGIAPILPNYTYNDGSKPIPKLAAQYTRANWGIPVYNFLTHVKANILYGYDNLPKVLHQVIPTGYMAKLNDKSRKITVRIEYGDGNGSGVIVAKEGNSYYVLTAKHVVQDEQGSAPKYVPTHQKFSDGKIITYDQDSHPVTSTVVAEIQDLAIVKFTSNTQYPVAQIGDYRPKKDATVFAGGFPGRDKINSPLWQWQLNPGLMFGQEDGKYSTQDKITFGSDGYNLLYTSISYGGMSGGPVFDTEGKVIGIHGRAEGDGDKILGNSAGISIQSFLGIAKQLNVNPQLLSSTKKIARELDVNESKSVLAVRDSIPEPQPDNGGEQWLQRGNQLYRIKKYPEAVRAFDIAISKGAEYQLFGNYGKALALRKDAKYADALTAISTAIATPQAKSASKRYYYLWKYQSMILEDLSKSDEAMKAIDYAIKLEPTDTILQGQKAFIFTRKSDISGRKGQYYTQALAIYNDLIENKPEVHWYAKRCFTKKYFRDYKGALSDCNLAILGDPNYAFNYAMRGLVKSESGDKIGAMLDFNRGIELDRDNSNYYAIRGIFKAEINNNSGALLDYDKAILLDPNNKNGYIIRGRLKSKIGDNQGALLDFDRAILLNPDAIYYGLRGNIKFQIGDNQGAIEDCNKGIKVDPTYSGNYFLRGNVQDKLKKYKEAIDDYTQVIKLDPNDATSYFSRGYDRSKLGDNQGAIDDFTQAIKFNPNLAYIYYWFRGNTKVEIGDYRGAILDHDKTIALDLKGEFPSAYYQRGYAKSNLSDYRGAILDYDKAIALDLKGEFPSAYSLRGNAKYNLREYRAAIVDYDKAISVDPKDVDAYYNRGNAKSQLGDKRGAILDFDKAISIAPKAENTYLNRGVAKFELGDTSGSMADMERIIAINPKNAYGYLNRGFLKIIIGRDGEALPDLERAIQLDSKQAYGYFSRGFIREMSGDKQGAISDYKQAMRINPNIIQDCKKQAEFVGKYNPAAYQKYQQMIQKLAAGSKTN
jgi:tetratricopeptide (TPR) repeat protein/S1-C subfamily serine protease